MGDWNNMEVPIHYEFPPIGEAIISDLFAGILIEEWNETRIELKLK